MYTSRLPVSTSVRRPTSHAEGSTSFVGLNRPSQVPVTVRKANLFTPQTKRPYSTGASTAGKSYMTTDKKYQRPLKPMPDRELQMKMFDTLTDYIRTNAPHVQPPDARKFFSSVSTTESSRIFECLISRILTDFKITRLEMDVPEALSALEYPYIRSVTKSALVSVTTRQAAVGLLVIFYWLIGAINQLDVDEIDDEDGDPLDIKAERSKILLKYPDSITEETRRLFETLNPPIDIQAKADEYEEVLEEVDKLRQELQEIEELYDEGKTIDDDIQKCEKYNAQMRKYIDTKRDELEALKQQSSRIVIDGEEKNRLKEAQSREIEKHELNVDSVKRDGAKFKTLRDKMNALTLEEKSTQSDINKDQLEVEKALEKSKLNRDKLTIQIRELLKAYESRSDIQTEHWVERKLELRKWVTRFEQVPYDDIEQNIKLTNDLSLFYQKMRATDSTIESEIRDTLTEKEMELESLERAIENYSKITLPRAREHIDRVTKETDNDVQQHLENLSKIDLQLENDDREMIQICDKSENTKAMLTKELAMEFQRFEQDKTEHVEMAELNRKLLKSVLDRNLQLSASLVNEVQSQKKLWEEARLQSDEDCKSVSKVARKIKTLGTVDCSV